MKRCLVVDDSNIIRKMACMFLEKLGFEVSEAENGLIAQKILQQNVPDLILMDWSMPEMDGLTLLKWIRQNINSQNAPQIIFCTSQNNMEDIQQAILAGANEYIIKPFTLDIIRNKLELLDLI